MGGKGVRWLPYLIYTLLSVAILGRLLRPGYILTLDMQFGPNIDFSSSLYGFNEGLWAPAGAPFFLLIQLLGRLLPVWLLQKIILFLIFFLAGLGAHRLSKVKGLGGYFAGLLYMVNPFTEARFLAGQWGVLAAYAMTPFAVKGFIELLENANGRKAVKVAALSTLVGLIQIHGFFLLFLAFFTLFFVKVITERRERVKTFQTSKYVGISAGLFCALNFYWLLPVLTARDTIMSQLGRADLLLFTPTATSRIMFDIASMCGFWRGGYLYTQNILPLWWLLFLLLMYLATYGFICKLGDNRHRWIAISFVTVGVVSFLLAVGAASDLTKPLFQWLWAHIPFIPGFRDSQKFVALLCLAYAYLGALGIDELVNGLQQQVKRLPRVVMRALLVVALLTPAAYSFTMFGFHGRLGVTDYPQEWYEVNDYLNQDTGDFNVLFLPWHLYMDYSWLPNRDKRLGNPAQQFFDKPVIAGDNLEMPGIYSQSTNPISKYVEFLLAHRDVNNLGELLAPLNVKYVVLVHEVDYGSYDFLYKQKDLTVVSEKEGVTLFRNEHPVARAYSVDNIVHVRDWDEYLKLSQEQDVSQYLYIIGEGESNGQKSAGIQEVAVREKSTVRYTINGSTRKYTVFTVPQDFSTEFWEYDGQADLAKNLGIMPVFASVLPGGELKYSRFYHTYLPSYIISVVVLSLLLVYYFLPRKR